MVHIKKDKGDLAVYKAMMVLTEQGFSVFTSITEHLPFDLVAYKNEKFYRIQVKYSSNGVAKSKTCWNDKHGTHSRKYVVTDFDFYAMYIPSVDMVVFPPISLMGKCIRTTPSNSYNACYWYEDFLEIKSTEPISRKRSDIRKPLQRKKITDQLTRQKFHISKEELEKLVWLHPTTELAKQLGVSDVAIAKRCKKLGIAKPPRGYWEKKYHNKPASIPI